VPACSVPSAGRLAPSGETRRTCAGSVIHGRSYDLVRGVGPDEQCLIYEVDQHGRMFSHASVSSPAGGVRFLTAPAEVLVLLRDGVLPPAAARRNIAPMAQRPIDHDGHRHG
jgi:hypothetical protein